VRRIGEGGCKRANEKETIILEKRDSTPTTSIEKRREIKSFREGTDFLGKAAIAADSMISASDDQGRGGTFLVTKYKIAIEPSLNGFFLLNKRKRKKLRKGSKKGCSARSLTSVVSRRTFWLKQRKGMQYRRGPTDRSTYKKIDHHYRKQTVFGSPLGP